jgi:hypothetical protein
MSKVCISVQTVSDIYKLWEQFTFTSLMNDMASWENKIIEKCELPIHY